MKVYGGCGVGWECDARKDEDGDVRIASRGEREEKGRRGWASGRRGYGWRSSGEDSEELWEGVCHCLAVCLFECFDEVQGS